jgi:Ca-activated chloride channel family protein
MALFALLLILPLLALMARAIARLRHRRARFAESPALDRMAVSGNDGEILVRMALTAAALALGILALAGPRWGEHLGSLLPGESPSMVIALDVSQSMLADDLEGGRFTRARTVMTEVVEGLPGWRVGLVAFADEAQVFCPMTTDAGALITLAQRARPGAELKGGSNLEVALATSQELLGNRPGAILLLTDGEQLAGDASKALRTLKESGTQLLAVGIGTERGGKIASGTDLFGQAIYRTYRGELVISRLDERGLKALAANAGGQYLNAHGPEAGPRAVQILTERWGGAQSGEAGLSLAGWPMVLCLMLLIAETAFSARRRLAKLSFPRVLDSVLKRSGHLIAVLALTQLAWTWPWAGALGGAAASYEKGDYPAAVSQLERAVAAKPDDPRLLYDLGCSRYQSGDFPGAALAFKKALDRLPPDSKLLPWAHYNLGNALFRQSEQAKEGKGLLKEAAKAYEEALAIAPDDEDAQHNLAVVKARLSDQPSRPNPPSASGQGNSTGSGDVPDLPAPDQAEIEATLDALEHDERQRQSEAAETAPQTPATARDLMRQLLRQGPESSQQDRKDW